MKDNLIEYIVRFCFISCIQNKLPKYERKNVCGIFLADIRYVFIKSIFFGMRSMFFTIKDMIFDNEKV